MRQQIVPAIPEAPTIPLLDASDLPDDDWEVTHALGSYGADLDFEDDALAGVSFNAESID